jgi:hypothetical protein
MAVATITETDEPPPGSRSGNAALPVPDTVMSGPRLGRCALMLSWWRLAHINSSSVNKDINFNPIEVLKYLIRCPSARVGPTLRKDRHGPTIATRLGALISCREVGSFPRKLNVT